MISISIAKRCGVMKMTKVRRWRLPRVPDYAGQTDLSPNHAAWPKWCAVLVEMKKSREVLDS
jgi:hypothetical protein